MLDEPPVALGGEFGWTPMVKPLRPDDAENAGPDHRPNAHSVWTAGGGLSGGRVVGNTDELCLDVLEDPVHVLHLQETCLRLLGFDHEKLTCRHMGRDFRLTDVRGHVAKQLLAKLADVSHASIAMCRRPTETAPAS